MASYSTISHAYKRSYSAFASALQYMGNNGLLTIHILYEYANVYNILEGVCAQYSALYSLTQLSCIEICFSSNTYWLSNSKLNHLNCYYWNLKFASIVSIFWRGVGDGWEWEAALMGWWRINITMNSLYDIDIYV